MITQSFGFSSSNSTTQSSAVIVVRSTGRDTTASTTIEDPAAVYDRWLDSTAALIQWVREPVAPPRYLPPPPPYRLPPRAAFTARYGFQQMARVPCYRGVRRR